MQIGLRYKDVDCRDGVLTGTTSRVAPTPRALSATYLEIFEARFIAMTCTQVNLYRQGHTSPVLEVKVRLL